MGTINRKFLTMFFFLGERIGLILIIISFFSFFLIQHTNQVFSKSADPKFVQQNGEWYRHAIEMTHPTKTLDNSYAISSAVITPTPTPKLLLSADNDSVWIRLAECETHQNWTENTGNGYYGGLQFNLGAWQSAGGTGLPSEASQSEQITRAKILQKSRGFTPWKSCAVKIGAL